MYLFVCFVTQPCTAKGQSSHDRATLRWVMSLSVPPEPQGRAGPGCAAGIPRRMRGSLGTGCLFPVTLLLILHGIVSSPLESWWGCPLVMRFLVASQGNKLSPMSQWRELRALSSQPPCRRHPETRQSEVESDFLRTENPLRNFKLCPRSLVPGHQVPETD